MHSLISLGAIIAYFSVAVSAQSIDPNSVPIGTRDQWCTSQISECPLICLQTAGNSAGTDANTCDPVALSYDCVCSNGIAPNASEYSQTLPYFICTQFNINCVASCGQDNTCAAACNQDHPCGATDPTRVNTSTISTMLSTSTVAGSAASTASDGPVYTGFGGGSAATTTGGSGSTASPTSSHSASSAARALAIGFGQLYGLGFVAAGIFAGFTLLL